VTIDSIHIIQNPQRRMQRLGFLKYLVYQASKRNTSTLQLLGNNLISAVSKKVSVPATAELVDYFSVTLREQRDKSMLAKVKEAIERSGNDSMVSVQIQDAYLASKNLPSQRGRLVLNDIKFFPSLATNLGLLRKSSYTPLVRGLVLLQLVSVHENSAFSEYNKNLNPLILTIEQKLLLLFTLIEHDEHILLPLHHALLLHNDEFADWEAGNLLPEIMRGICQQYRPLVRSGADAVFLRKLWDTAEVIEQWKGKPYSGKGARDENATIRLEPFVDIGVFSKKDKFAYQYQFTPVGRHIMSGLTEDEKGGSKLDDRFFSLATAAYGISTTHLSKPDDIMHFVYLSYKNLASPLGYAPIREVLLLAAILAISTNSGYFEIADGFDVLKSEQKANPKSIIFNVDRMGRLNIVKFTGTYTSK